MPFMVGALRAYQQNDQWAMPSSAKRAFNKNFINPSTHCKILLPPMLHKCIAADIV